MQKSVALTVPCHAEKALCSVCLPPSSTEETANRAFFFSGNRDAALTSSLSFPVPNWLFRADRAVTQQASRVWAGGALLTVE